MKRTKVFFIALLAIILLTGCVEAKEPHHNEDSNQVVIEQITENLSVKKIGDEMAITTPYGDLKYPFAFSDIIHIEEEFTDEVQKIHFSVKTENFSHLIYTLTFGDEVGVLIGHIGDKIVSINIVTDDVESSAENKKIFTDAQKTVGDIINSMYEWENYVPVA